MQSVRGRAQLSVIISFFILFTGLLSAFSVPEASAEPLPPVPLHYHVLSQPLEYSVKLGFLSKLVHFGISPIYDFGSVALLYSQTKEPISALTLFSYKLIQTPISLLYMTTADLKLRQTIEGSRRLTQLKKIPDLHSIRMLTAGETEMLGLIIANKRNNSGVIFVATSKPLPEQIPESWLGKSWNPEWGQPILIEDPGKTHLSITLTSGGRQSWMTWRPTLKEAMSDTPVPLPVVTQWRKDFKIADLKNRALLVELGKGPLARKFNPLLLTPIELHATLIMGDGQIITVGKIAEGAAAKKLLGLSSLGRLKRWIYTWGPGLDPKQVRENRLPMIRADMRPSLYKRCLAGILRRSKV